MSRIIDAHQHFWQVAAQDQPWRGAHHGAIARDFEPSDLHAELRSAGVDATILMQSVDESAENDRLVQYGADHAVAGVVSWLPLRSPDEARAEWRRVGVPKHSGVRCLIADDPMDWLADAGVVALFNELAEAGLAWDVVPLRPAQIENVLRLGKRVPKLQIVIDHLGRPPVETGGWHPWAENVLRLGELPNIAMKVSVGLDVLTAWKAWDRGSLDAYVAHAVSAFGPDRLMLASNWPVVVLRASYAQAWNDLRSTILSYVPEGPGEDAVLGGTASRVYSLT